MIAEQNRKKGQHTLEIAIVIVVVALALLAMQAYFKRSYQGKVKDSSDDIGKQFSPGQTLTDTETSLSSQATENVSPQGGTVSTVNETSVRLAKEYTPGLDQEPLWPEGAGIGTGATTQTDNGSSGRNDTSTGNTGDNAAQPESGAKDEDAGNIGSDIGIGTGSGSSSGGSGGGSVGTGSGSSGGARSSGSGNVGGIRTYDSSIEAALAVLQASNFGAGYASLILEKNISVTYGDFSDDPSLVAYFDPDNNAIVVNQRYRTQSSEQAIAAIICHEATHADYNYNPEKWIAITKENHPEFTDNQIHIPANSIDQEYNAFRNSVILWAEVKDGLSDGLLDDLTQSFNQGEAYFKGQLMLVDVYARLPQY